MLVRADSPNHFNCNDDLCYVTIMSDHRHPRHCMHLCSPLPLQSHFTHAALFLEDLHQLTVLTLDSAFNPEIPANMSAPAISPVIGIMQRGACCCSAYCIITRVQARPRRRTQGRWACGTWPWEFGSLSTAPFPSRSDPPRRCSTSWRHVSRCRQVVLVFNLCMQGGRPAAIGAFVTLEHASARAFFAVAKRTKVITFYYTISEKDTQKLEFPVPSIMSVDEVWLARQCEAYVM